MRDRLRQTHLNYKDEGTLKSLWVSFSDSEIERLGHQNLTLRPGLNPVWSHDVYVLKTDPIFTHRCYDLTLTPLVQVVHRVWPRQ